MMRNLDGPRRRAQARLLQTHVQSMLNTTAWVCATSSSVSMRKPTIMFLGDSFVWGLDAEADERFTELLRTRISSHKIVAAGVSGYGTDQEYLLLQRLWPKIQPAVVVLIFCTQNDRLDNSTNIRYEGYQKPYFTIASDGSLVLQGQPVPKSRLQYIKEDWLVRHLWLARLVSAVYLKIQHPVLFVPDPTERLVGKLRDFVQANGAQVSGWPSIPRSRPHAVSSSQPHPFCHLRWRRILSGRRRRLSLDAGGPQACRRAHSWPAV